MDKAIKSIIGIAIFITAVFICTAFLSTLKQTQAVEKVGPYSQQTEPIDNMWNQATSLLTPDSIEVVLLVIGGIGAYWYLNRE